MKRFLPYFFGVIVSIIFGLSFLFTKGALDVLKAGEIIFLRFLLAALIMTMLYFFGVIKLNYRKKKTKIKYIIFISIFQPILYFMFETHALKYSTTSQAGLMIALVPVITVILGIILLKEKIRLCQICFIILSVSGVIVTILDGAVNDKVDIRGFLFLFGAIICAAFFNISSRRASQIFTSQEITFAMMWIGAIFYGIVYIITGYRSGYNIISKLNREAIVSLLYLGTLSSVVAFFLANYNLSKIPASQYSVFANLTTVVSLLAGVIIRHEPFNLVKLIGVAMIISGVFSTNYFSIKGNR